LYFLKLVKVGKGLFTTYYKDNLIESKDEFYFKHDRIAGVEEIDCNTLVVEFYEKNYLALIDRMKK
jgi:hypothetical protein